LPIYEYRCDRCGHTFEVFQKFSDDPIEVCEKCGGPVVKVLYPAALHFKGSGFYTTDYGRSTTSRRVSKDEGETKGHSGGSGDDGAHRESGSSAKGDGGQKSGETARKGAEVASKASST